MLSKYKGKQEYIFILHIDQQFTKIILIRKSIIKQKVEKSKIIAKIFSLFCI